MISKSQNPVWLAVGGLIALASALGVGRFVYTPILPLMIEDLGMTTTMAGALASANFAGYLIGALVAASSAMLGSRRRWLIAALSVSAVSTGAMGEVDPTQWTVEGVLISGIFCCIFQPFFQEAEDEKTTAESFSSVQG